MDWELAGWADELDGLLADVGLLVGEAGAGLVLVGAATSGGVDWLGSDGGGGAAGEVGAAAGAGATGDPGEAGLMAWVLMGLVVSERSKRA